MATADDRRRGRMERAQGVGVGVGVGGMGGWMDGWDWDGGRSSWDTPFGRKKHR